MDYRYLETLAEISRAKGRGELLVTGEKSRRRLFFKDGRLCFATSNLETERLGEVLYELAFISKETGWELKNSIIKPDGKEKLGKILVKKGKLAPEKLFTALKYQIRKIALAPFSEEKLQWFFTEGDPEIPTDSHFVLSLEELIEEGIVGVTLNREFFLSLQGQISREAPPAEGDPLFGRDIRALWEAMNVPKGGEELRAAFPSMEEGTFWKNLFRMKLYGWVKVEGGEKDSEDAASALSEDFLQELDEAYEIVKSQVYSTLLPDKLKGEERKREYLRLVKKFHPDKLPPGTDEEIKKRSEAVLDGINKAFERPPGSSGEENRDDDNPELILKQSLQRAKLLYRGEKYLEVIDLLQSVLGYKNDDGEALFLLALAQSKVEGFKKKAEGTFLKLIEVMPWHADAYYYLIQLYESEGMASRAGGLLEKSVSLFPNNKKLTDLHEKHFPPKKGLFGLFRK